MKKITNSSPIEFNRLGLLSFYKGRVALYALLHEMGIGEGDQVLMPAYTCVVVPNAVLYLGAEPLYTDIELSSFSVFNVN
jgi:dTDP-4-amino-4,6-dideoxygalactose transaminase